MGDPAVGLASFVIKACGKWDFQHHAVSPVLGNGWSLLGEQSKWVPVSAARFHGLTWWSDESDDGTGAATGASVIATGILGFGFGFGLDLGFGFGFGVTIFWPVFQHHATAHSP